MSRVAVLGAGLLGSLAALDLAQHGVEVDLIDELEEPVSAASYFAEGKIHLGFLYALDASRATPLLMMRGAVTFRSLVDRIVGVDVAGMLSTPFLYGVSRGSLLNTTQFGSHLHRCQSEFAQRTGPGREYVDGSRESRARLMPRSEWVGDFDDAVFADVFETNERAVDPRRLAAVVRAEVLRSDAITFHPGVRVDTIEKRPDGRFHPSTEAGLIIGDGPYDIVVNSTWSDLLRLDQDMGLAPPPDWSFRYKLGNRVLVPLTDGEVPSITVVLGAYGDLVNFGPTGGLFVSWYPTGRMHMTADLQTPDWNAAEYSDDRRASFEASLHTWQAMSPALRRLDLRGADVDCRGGIILATGRIDVDQASSPLHSRVDVGIRERDGYLSVNTGKYTLAPMFARQVAERVRLLLR